MDFLKASNTSDDVKAVVSDVFHNFFYYSDYTWNANTYMGLDIQQCPLDMQLY